MMDEINEEEDFRLKVHFGFKYAFEKGVEVTISKSKMKML